MPGAPCLAYLRDMEFDRRGPPAALSYYGFSYFRASITSFLMSPRDTLHFLPATSQTESVLMLSFTIWSSSSVISLCSSCSSKVFGKNRVLTTNPLFPIYGLSVVAADSLPAQGTAPYINHRDYNEESLARSRYILAWLNRKQFTVGIPLAYAPHLCRQLNLCPISQVTIESPTESNTRKYRTPDGEEGGQFASVTDH
jgi:hypothetical protein